MTRLRRVLIGVALFAGAVVGAEAQTPAQLIASGQEAFDLARLDDAAGLFHRALDPRLNANDRERGLAASYLGAIYAAQNYRDVARTWLRWALRTVPTFDLDTLLFGPDVQTILALAEEGVDAGFGDDPNVIVRWQWSDLAVTGLRGRLVARTTTQGAQIRVNENAYLGPDVELIPGTFRVSVSAQGFRPWDGTLEVLPGASTHLIVTLEPVQAARPGYLYVNAVPWGLVSVDGREVGFTLLARLELSAGTHQLRIDSPGYEPYTQSFELTSGQILRLGTIPLRRLPARSTP